MKATIVAITLDFEGTDMVLAVPQLVQAVRNTLSAPTNGAGKPAMPASTIQLPPPTPAVAAPGEPGCESLPGVTILKPLPISEEPAAPLSDNVVYFTHCLQCGRPKKATKNHVCQSCATKAAKARARERHNGKVTADAEKTA